MWLEPRVQLGFYDYARYQLAASVLELQNRPNVDPSHLYLADSPWPMVAIVVTYLIFVLKLGRQFMKNREPYDLRLLLLAYNLVQVVYNGVLFLTGAYYMFILRPYSLSCMAILPLDHPLKSFDRMLCYAYYLNKYLDLLDTVFIVFRKSYKQITFLHLLHHLHMPIASYFMFRYVGYGGHPMIMGVLNLFVHVIMYTYYFVATRRSTVKRYIWWKQYLTILQMLQFVLISAHSVWTLAQPDCPASRPLAYVVLVLDLSMMALFSNFYIHAYILPRPKLQKLS